MPRSILAAFLFVVAIAHAVAGGLVADASTGTLVIAGAGATTRWIATELWAASIAGYLVGAAGMLGSGAMRKWSLTGVTIAAVTSLLLAGLLRAGSVDWTALAIVDGIVIAAAAWRAASAGTTELVRATR